MRSSGRVVPPLAARRSPTDEFLSFGIMGRKRNSLRFYLDSSRLEEAANEIAEEEQRNIDDGRKHILRLPEVNLVYNLHTHLFRL